MNTSKIIIVGAGPSGIAAASRLLENGFTDIVLLEAEDRIGGRVNTVKFGDGIVDMGGQWVAGEGGNVVFSMANPLNLLTRSVTSFFDNSTTYVESSGRCFQIEEKSHIFKIITDINNDRRNFLKTYTGSFGDYFIAEFQKQLKERHIVSEDYILANSILEWYEKFENSATTSDSWFETSGQGLTHYEDCDGHLLWSWKSGGYRTVLDLLMKKYPNDDKELPVLEKIVFKKEVEKITWDNLEGDKEGKVIVKCADNSMYEADYILITVSLGVLKERANSLFSPSLPEEKLVSIKGLSFGTLNKVYLKFPHRWWPSDVHGFNLLWSKEDKEDFLMKNKKRSRDKSWLQEVYGFYGIDNQPLVLLVWGVGGYGRHMEQLTESEVTEDLMELLNKFLGERYNIPQPSEIKRSTWYSNPHFRGTVSYRSMESHRLSASASQLAKPVTNSLGKEVLLFAGEATNDNHYASVHGAIETGWREADRLIKLC